MSTKKLTIEQFTILAIEKLAADGKNSIHAVYSGFNEAFREYFPGKDPVAEVKKLTEAGKVECRPARGGAVIGKPGSGVAKPKDSSGAAALNKMGLG